MLGRVNGTWVRLGEASINPLQSSPLQCPQIIVPATRDYSAPFSEPQEIPQQHQWRNNEDSKFCNESPSLDPLQTAVDRVAGKALFTSHQSCLGGD